MSSHALKRFVLLLWAGVLLMAAPARLYGAEPTFKIIAHPSTPVDVLTTEQLQAIFMKKTHQWSNKTTIQPVDQLLDSPARILFSMQVLKKAARSVKSQWQQAIFAGSAIPPPELQTDQDVVTFVLRTPGAIGYVDGAVSCASAKVITIRD
jgi:ABC-type phosphate transport system substrate-binding protein